MKRLALFFWLIASPAWAFLPGQPVGMLNSQVLPTSAGTTAVSYDFTAGGYPYAGGVCSTWGHQVPCYQLQTTARTQTVSSYCTAVDGLLVAVGANIARQCNGNGGLIEESRTNDALWSRDMTNAAWVKVGMGTALNATGADGTANSATTLTATGTSGSCTASCTALQTIALGSTADTYSVYLKRVTGSGTVNITINNLVGTTACTVTSTTSFTRCPVTATLANPVIGIQLTALNDVVIADFNQLEPGGFATSPIPTTTTSVARNADNVLAARALLAVYNSPALTQYTKTSGLQNTGGGANSRLASGYNTGAVMAYVAGPTGPGSYNGTTSIVTTAGGSANYSGVVGTVGSYDSTGRSIVAQGGVEVTDTSTFATPFSVAIGSSTGGASYLDGSLARLQVWNSRLPASVRVPLSAQ